MLPEMQQKFSAKKYADRAENDGGDTGQHILDLRDGKNPPAVIHHITEAIFIHRVFLLFASPWEPIKADFLNVCSAEQSENGMREFMVNYADESQFTVIDIGHLGAKSFGQSAIHQKTDYPFGHDDT